MPHDDIHDEKVPAVEDAGAPTTDGAPTTESAKTAIKEPDSALPPVLTSILDTGYTAAGVPTFDGVREKIETRYGTALGSTELAEETPAGRAADQQFAARQRAAAEKLEEIRASMHKPD